jgi:hypothetical protein
MALALNAPAAAARGASAAGRRRCSPFGGGSGGAPAKALLRLPAAAAKDAISRCGDGRPGMR